jgi:hypothetical protein
MRCTDEHFVNYAENMRAGTSMVDKCLLDAEFKLALNENTSKRAYLITDTMHKADYFTPALTAVHETQVAATTTLTVD